MSSPFLPAYGCTEGPLGFPMPDAAARAVDALLKGLPRSKEFEYRYFVAGKAPTELNPGERSDVSWITTESVDRTGEVVVARAAMKPLATLNRPVLKTVDVTTKEETVSFKERTDVTAVPAMAVVAETMVALVLAGEALRKFGGDSVAETVRNRDAYLATLRDG